MNWTRTCQSWSIFGWPVAGQCGFACFNILHWDWTMLAVPSGNLMLLRNSSFLHSIHRGITRQRDATRTLCSNPEGPEMKDLLHYIDSLKNYEKSGIPRGAGTDSHDGFDLGRMRRLLERFGNPQSKFKVWFFSIFFFLFLVKYIVVTTNSCIYVNWKGEKGNINWQV